MKWGRGLLVACAALLLSAQAHSPLLAAVDQRVNFQGRLVDPATKNPQNGTFDMTFRICDSLASACTGGNKLWEEVHASGVPDNSITVDNGVFEVLLGELTALSSAPFSGAAYLEIEVEGQVLSPREQLVSVPQALRAAVAESLEAGDPNYIHFTDILQAGAEFHVTSGTAETSFLVGGTLRVVGNSSLEGDLTVDGTLIMGSGLNVLTNAAGLLDATKLNTATLVPNDSIDDSSITMQGQNFNGANQLLQLNGSALVPDALLDGSVVTKLGNSFNGANQLLQLDAGGLIPNARIDSASITMQGQDFNGPNQLLLLDGTAFVPTAQLNSSIVTKEGNTFNGASQLLKLNASALVDNARIDSSSITMQGQDFNGANQLVMLDSNGTLNAAASGTGIYSITTSSSINVTGTGAKVREGGNDLLPSGAIIMWADSAGCPPGYAEMDGTGATVDMRGRLPIGKPAAGTIANTGGAAAFTADGDAVTHSHTVGAAEANSFRIGSNNRTDVADTTMPYIYIMFCRKQ